MQRGVLIFTFCSLLILRVNGQYTREDAINLVINQILLNDINNVNVYASLMIMQGSEGLELPDARYITYPYNNNWVFFVDDKPTAQWEHECRYIFVNSANGIYSIIQDKIFPIGLNEHFEIVSNIYFTYPIISKMQNNSSINTEPNSHLYAVIIVGVHDSIFWNDISALYTTLKKYYGYKDENIYVHYYTGLSTDGKWNNDLDNDAMSDIDNNAEKSTIYQTFDFLNSILSKDDQLFVYIGDHGGRDASLTHSILYLPDPNHPDTPPWDMLYDYEFKDYVKNIDCGQMIFLMQQCNSGGFVPYLMNYDIYPVICKNRTIHTSCSADQPANMEIYLSGGNFSEFSFYWIAAIRGYFPRITYDPINNDYIIEPWLEGDAVFPFPYNDDFSGCPNHPTPFHNPDSNNDGIVTMDEAFSYADDYDTWSGYNITDNYYCPKMVCPVQCPDIPDSMKNICFHEDLQSLTGITGNANITRTLDNRSYIVGGTLTITGNSTLTLPDNCEFHFMTENSNMMVDNGSSLIVGNNVQFSGHEDSYVYIWGGLSDLNHVTFNKTGFINHSDPLNITLSSFTDCEMINSYNVYVNISQCHFTNTGGIFVNDISDPDISVNISDCIFQSNGYPDGIDLWNYKKFDIKRNTINGYYSGIQLSESGYGEQGYQSITQNDISSCIWSGITSYNSKATVIKNHIHGNAGGIRLFNTNTIALLGKSDAMNFAETQEIRDNAGIEVYASKNSLPYFMRFNAIIDNDNQGNPNDPLFLYDVITIPYPAKDIRYNCWGQGFNYLQDLNPPAAFVYDPPCCPGEDCDTYPDLPEDMFNSAEEQIDAGNYAEAKSLFQLLIEQYPDSYFAQAAIKELFRLEQFAGNDYMDLQQYYLTNDSITSDTILAPLGEFFANRCNVQVEDWPPAIQWYENILQNPPSTEDSIFAVIDLGFIYILMANEGTKCSYVGSMPQFKPASLGEFQKKKDELLGLLPLNHKLHSEQSALKGGYLMQNIPNPSSGNTKISYSLETEGDASIRIFDNTGRTVRIVHCPNSTEGKNEFILDTSNLPEGIYFYSLEVNGVVYSTKKMIIMR